MLQINYPKNSKQLDAFKQAYVKAVYTDVLEDKLRKYFTQRTLNVPKPPTLKKLLIMSIDELYKESLRVGKYIKTDLQKNKLKKILNYDKSGSGYSAKKQPRIAQFFSENDDKLKLLTCYYCNVDYIYAFANIGDYKNNLDFINRARKFELLSIQGMVDQKAQIIIDERKKKKITDIDKLPKSISSGLKKNIKALIVKGKSNHFTLDHVLNKADFPLAALSLFNLVPCCYSCNSKFKGEQKLIEKKEKIFLSPTSDLNTFSKEFKFKLLFTIGSASKLNAVSKIDDILLDFDLSKNQRDYELFLNIFRIHSRYVLHKREAFELISKKKKYSDSHIKQMAKIVRISESKIKSDIFGTLLFEGDLEDFPLTKLKRDVAKNIGIKGVK